MNKKLIWFSFIFFAGISAMGQDTLPNFSLRNVGNNRIIIGWNNQFENIRQISIQRSRDSLTGYKTILTVPDPDIPQNGYVDTKAEHDNMYYRLYIMLDKGMFLFSDAKRPVRDTFRIVQNSKSDPVPVADTIQIGDSFLIIKPFSVNIEKFHIKDSVASPQLTSTKPKMMAFTPSLYVYTNRDGYVRINLPAADKPKKYSIRFFEENGDPLFELVDFTERDFKIDKANFYHAGWFLFELYEEGKLLEKHKFFIQKEF